MDYGKIVLRGLLLAFAAIVIVGAGTIVSGLGAVTFLDWLFVIGVGFCAVAVIFTRPTVFRRRAIERAAESEPGESVDDSDHHTAGTTEFDGVGNVRGSPSNRHDERDAGADADVPLSLTPRTSSNGTKQLSVGLSLALTGFLLLLISLVLPLGTGV